MHQCWVELCQQAKRSYFLQQEPANGRSISGHCFVKVIFGISSKHQVPERASPSAVTTGQIRRKSKEETVSEWRRSRTVEVFHTAKRRWMLLLRMFENGRNPLLSVPFVAEAFECKCFFLMDFVAVRSKQYFESVFFLNTIFIFSLARSNYRCFWTDPI